MSKRGFTLCAGAAAIALLLIGLSGCMIQSQPSDKPPEGTYSIDDLLTNLDSLEGPQARSITGRSIFTLPGGGELSLRDLSSYLTAIKSGFSSSVSSATNGSPYLVTATRLSWSTPKGRESGLMWTPFTWFRSKSFPVISYQHGTQVNGPIAPSRFSVNPFSVFSSDDQSGALQNYVECIVGALMASAGYIVVMPDYTGFGDSYDNGAPDHPIHPYVASVLGNSVVGAVRTAQAALAGKRGGPKPDGRLFLTGYSEGGYVTMVSAPALLEQGITVNGVVPADGPYDLSGTMVDEMLSDASPPPKVPWYLLYTVSGYHAAYPDVLSDAVIASLFVDDSNDWSAKVSLFDGQFTNAQIDAEVPYGTYPYEMLEPGPLMALRNHDSTNEVWGLLDENNGWADWSAAEGVQQIPVVLIHCPEDDIVPAPNQTAAFDALTTKYGDYRSLITTVPVPAVPFIDTLLGSIHTAAYPTAMLAAFTAIQRINSPAY